MAFWRVSLVHSGEKSLFSPERVLMPEIPADDDGSDVYDSGYVSMGVVAFLAFVGLCAAIYGVAEWLINHSAAVSIPLK
jgi:hypothetical protein